MRNINFIRLSNIKYIIYLYFISTYYIFKFYILFELIKF